MNLRLNGIGKEEKGVGLKIIDRDVSDIKKKYKGLKRL